MKYIIIVWDRSRTVIIGLFYKLNNKWDISWTNKIVKLTPTTWMDSIPGQNA